MPEIGKVTGVVELKDAFSATFNDFGNQLKNTQSLLNEVGPSLTAALTVPILAIGVATTKMASDAEESENLFSETFQEMETSVRAWSEATSDALGLNAFALRKSAGSFFLLANNMGQTRDEAGVMAKTLVELTADLASFLNIDPTETAAALQSGLVGNTEALRSLNVFVNEASLRQIAFQEGLTETNRQLSQTEKFQATYAAILKQTAVAQGDLIRTADSFENVLRRLRSEAEETAVVFGSSLIPIWKDTLIPAMESILGLTKDVSSAFSELPSSLQMSIVGIAGLAALSGPVALLTAKFLGLVASISSLTPAMAALVTTVGGVLAPALLAGATAIAAYKITDFILEWTGLRETLDEVAVSIFEVGENFIKYHPFLSLWSETTSDVIVVTAALAQASKIAGEEITDFGEATKIINDNLKELQGGAEEVEKSINAMAVSLEDEVKAAIEAAEETKSLKDATKLLNRDVTDLAEAERALAIASSLASGGTEELEERIREMGQAALEARDKMDQLRETAEELASKAFADYQAAMDVEIAENFAEAQERIRDAWVASLPPLSQYARETEEAKSSSIDFGEELQDLAHAFDLLGISADSFFGKIIGGFAAAMDAGADFKTAIKSQDIGGAFQAGAQGVGAFMAATETGSAASRALGGAMTGAAIGAQIGGPIGAGIGAAAGAILGAFRGGAMRSLMKDVTNEMGVQISEDLAEALEKSGMPIQLAVADIFAEAFAAGGDVSATADRFAEEIGDIFSGLGQGLFTESEAITALEEAIPLLIANFDELGAVGEEQVNRIINAARTMGIEFEGLNELIAAQMGPTLQDIAEQFGLTIEEAKRLEEVLGVNLPSEMQVLAAQMGTTPKIMKEIGAAMEAQLGIPIEDLQALLDILGISFEDFAKSLGIEIPDAVGAGAEGTESLVDNTAEAGENLSGASGQARILADELERAARASSQINVSVPSTTGGVPGLAEGAVVNQPMVAMIGEGGPEVVAPVQSLFGALGAQIAQQVANAGGATGANISVTLAPQIVLADPMASPEDIERKVIPVVVKAIREDVDSIVGEIGRQLEHS